MPLDEDSSIASQLVFDCHPAANFMSLPLNGLRVHFAEKVLYRFRDGWIAKVASVIEEVAIRPQLR